MRAAESRGLMEAMMSVRMLTVSLGMCDSSLLLELRVCSDEHIMATICHVSWAGIVYPPRKSPGSESNHLSVFWFVHYYFFLKDDCLR